MNGLVFHIETVPDTDAGRRLYGNPAEMAQLSDEDVGRVMALHRRRQTDGQTDSLPLHLQRVVAIAGGRRAGEPFELWSAGTPESSEAALIQHFFDEMHAPVLVSWNGSNLPVLHYRAMLHGISAPRYWNHFFNAEHHIDLMAVLSADQTRVPLGEMASLLGFPGRLAGAEVWETWLSGDIQTIRANCETDALNIYLVYLRFELMRGNLTPQSYAAECEAVRSALQAENKAHFNAFLAALSPAPT